MKILGKTYEVKEIFDSFMTVPDCVVVGKNKIGTGHGEAKFYIGSKDVMREFYGGLGFKSECFLLKSDLLSYMNAVKTEYIHPSQEYAGRNELPELWKKRFDYINSLDDIIFFNIKDQIQIEGERGYVNSKDEGYSIIREISLPLVSYISAMKLTDKSGKDYFYWKLFVDFDAIEEKESALVYTYGKKKEPENPEPIEERKKQPSKKTKDEIRYARYGQGKYREQLLEECPFCPFTKINDERLLIASHIKPWVVSNDKEKIDPKNGYILSPMYDRLFDRGFITFTPDRKLIVSDWLSPQNRKRIGIENGTFIQALPMDDARIKYLEFHHSSVFHGVISE